MSTIMGAKRADLFRMLANEWFLPTIMERLSALDWKQLAMDRLIGSKAQLNLLLKCLWSKSRGMHLT